MHRAIASTTPKQATQQILARRRSASHMRRILFELPLCLIEQFLLYNARDRDADPFRW
jgi:hypothetical protein